MSYFTDVQDFHRVVCGIETPSVPTIPDHKRRDLRIALMAEEYDELIEAIFDESLPGIAREAIDLIVTVLGTLDEYGIPADEVWAEVHRSNMAKVGGPVREDGKRLKPEGWEPPRVAEIFNNATLMQRIKDNRKDPSRLVKLSRESLLKEVDHDA